MIELPTPRAAAWLRANVDAEATWVGDRLAVQPRFLPPLIDAVFLAERDALPH